MLVPSVVERCRVTSALGSMARAQDELKKLKHLPKTVETTDHLMVYIHVLFASNKGGGICFAFVRLSVCFSICLSVCL